jgi:hypothetical protein
LFRPSLLATVEAVVEDDVALLHFVGADIGGGRTATETEGARWVNVVLGNIKRSIGAPITRSNNASTTERRPFSGRAALSGRSRLALQSRYRLRELVPRLLRAMVLCGPCAEPVLRQASNFVGGGSALIRYVQAIFMPRHERGIYVQATPMRIVVR